MKTLKLSEEHLEELEENGETRFRIFGEHDWIRLQIRPEGKKIEVVE